MSALFACAECLLFFMTVSRRSTYSVRILHSCYVLHMCSTVYVQATLSRHMTGLNEQVLLSDKVTRGELTLPLQEGSVSSPKWTFLLRQLNLHTPAPKWRSSSVVHQLMQAVKCSEKCPMSEYTCMGCSSDQSDLILSMTAGAAAPDCTLRSPKTSSAKGFLICIQLKSLMV